MGSSSSFDFDSLTLHRERLRGFVLALLGDEHGADDVCQEVWIRAAGSGPREPRALGAWLRTVARRVVWNQRRLAANRQGREREVARAEALPSSAELAERLDLQRRVLDVLESLQEPHRTLLRDHYFGGLSVPELARRAGLSVHTVKDQVLRARVAMRRALERAGVDERDALPGALLALPLRPSIPFLFICSLAMKKVLLIAVGLVVVALTYTWTDRMPIERTVDSVGALVPGPEEPAEVMGIELPMVASAGERSALPVEALVAPVKSIDSPVDKPVALDWVVRGRVEYSEAAPDGQPKGERPIVRLRLSAHVGYDFTAPAFATAVVESSADGSIAWPLADPQRTVSIRAEVLGVLGAPGHEGWGAERYLAVMGEGPVESLYVRVNPRDAWLEGTVQASAAAPNPGAPIAGARIVVKDIEAISDELGGYRIAVASLGHVSVKVTAEGFQRGWEHARGVTLGEVTRLDFALDPEFGPEGTVFGYVRDSTGAALPNALVSCVVAREDEVRSDSNGYYELHGVEFTNELSVGFKASHANTAFQEKYLHGLADATERVEGRQLDFELVEGSRIEGVVLDSAGAPIRGFKVWVGERWGYRGNQEVYSDDQGAFALEHVAPGKMQIGAYKAGMPRHEQALEVPEGSVPMSLVLRLPRTLPLRGRVVDEDGAPVAHVLLQASGPSVQSHASTDADGRFEMAGVPESELRVKATREGWLDVSFEHVATGEELEVILERVARLTGRVVDAATGEPVERFRARFGSSSDKAHAPWLDDPDGSWVYEGGYSFSSIEGRWSSSDKDQIHRGAWAYVEVKAEGYEVLRLGPLLVPMEDPIEGGLVIDDPQWVHRLVRQ